MSSKAVETKRKPRSTTMNWVLWLETLIDGYKQQTSISHGVQKDALQNAWDAKTSKKGKGFGFHFSLVKGKNKQYLSMTDCGTTGLTGSILTPEEMYQDLPEEEKWGRFESLAFSKTEDKSTTPLGSRGRGKFIFVGASKTKRIFYDSLRQDGTYRFGWRNVIPIDSLIDAFDEDEGRDELRKMADGIFEPLDQVGTRVIIEDPIDELVEAIKSGEFEWMLGETWWELIKKYNADITVSYDGIKHQVGIPPEFDLPDDSTKKKKVWKKGPVKMDFGRVKTTVKALHMVCELGTEVREEIRGISVQRGGMKICTITPNVLPGRIAFSLYGYVCLDKVGESALRKAEDPEHNNISYNLKFARELRKWIRTEMSKFAAEKLGYSVDPRKERHEKQRNAEQRALNALNKVAKTLDLFHLGPSIGNGSGTSVPTSKPIRIEFPIPEFPNPPSRRVNYDQSLSNVQVTLVNSESYDVLTRLTVYTWQENEPSTELFKKDILLKANSTLQVYGPVDIKIEKKNYRKAGKYNLSAKLVSLQAGPTKGDRLDRKNVIFYVEYDPPSKGLFEAYVSMSGLSEENAHLIGFESTGEAGGKVLRYNADHPAYTILGNDVDRIAEYLFRFGALVLCKYDLGADSPKLFRGMDISSINPQDMMDQVAFAMGRLMFLYHKSSS